MSILAVYNLKGGVGKTATAVNLAYLSAREGARTLIWDLDPQGAASFYFRVKPRVKGGAKRLIKGKGALDRRIKGTDFENLDLLPADFSYRNMDLVLNAADKSDRRIARLLKPLKKDYDHIFLDCPPGFSLVSENAFLAADALLIPLIPTTLSLRTLEQIRKYFRKERPKKLRELPFFTMVDRRKRLHKEICAEYADGREGFLTTVIPYASAVERMGVARAPLLSFDRRSAAARAYRALWEEVKARLG